MLFIASPAKKLDYDTPLPKGLVHTQPQFIKQAAQLIEVLKKKTSPQIAELMHLSPALSALNAQRYAAWRTEFTAENSRPAAWAFNGDVYASLGIQSFTPQDADWAQQHVGILSGLYGVLRPKDLMQAYRLEMGTSLVVGESKNLYQYWTNTITAHLNQAVAEQHAPVLVNLASQEYFKAVDPKALKARVVECVFQEWRNPGYKIIGLMAKRARGLMLRYAIQTRAQSPDDLKHFNLDGYAYDAGDSASHRLIFKRGLCADGAC
jgi:uncharacterized protein